jgi:hypothetical protein
VVAAVDDARELIASLQAALVQASGRISELGMRVEELGLELKTVFERKASGELDLKLVKLGGGSSLEKASTISITMEPTDLVSAAQIDDELSEALTVIEAALAALHDDFSLADAAVGISFATQVDGKITVILGGELSRELTHVARIKFVPAE